MALGKSQEKQDITPSALLEEIAAKQIVSSLKFTLALSNSGDVYYCSSLPRFRAFSDHEDEKEQEPCFEKINFNEVKVSQIAVAGYSAVFLTECGSVFTIGSNTDLTLGLDHAALRSLPYYYNYKQAETPQHVSRFPAGTIITQVQAGIGHAVALDKLGNVFTFGRGEFGELGLGRDVSEAYTPERIPSLKNIIQIAAQNNSMHSLALAEDKKVYGWGVNHFGQLGLGKIFLDEDESENFTFDPIEIKRLAYKNVVHVGVGYYCSYAVTKSGDLFTWGCSDDGELGLGFDKSSLSYVVEPTLVTKLGSTPICKIVCGSDHFILLSANTSVLTIWGNNTYNQSPTDNNAEKSNTPQKLSFFQKKRVLDVFASLGQSFVVVQDEIWPYFATNPKHLTDIKIVC